MNRVECRVLRVERQRMLRSEELARSEERGARSENQSARQLSLRADSSLFPVPHSPFPISASSPLAPRSSRQRRPGVLLLVVLSMLVLFMLVGTAFLMTADQSRVSSKSNAKKDRLGNVATQDLTRALMQLLRDTENPYAATYTHSILRDFYGTDGFRGQVQIVPTTAPFVPGNLPQEVTRYAAATPPPNELGPTQGQFIDIYFSSVVPNPGDTIDIRHTPKIDLNVLGQPQAYVLPLTKGYFNGQLLTVTSGPAAGQTTRILDYEHLGSATSGTGPNQRPLHFFRMRVMAFGRADGNSLTIDRTTNHAPEITDLVGATFLVNGRPFSGTGVGYNPLAQAGQARLSAVQLLPVGSSFIGAELALLPNARYLSLDRVGTLNPLGPLVAVPDHFTVGGAVDYHNPSVSTQPAYNWLNDPAPTANRTLWPYQSAVGAGGANEGYDAADFQNMWLALQTVTPRNQGRVVHGDTTSQQILDASDPTVLTNAAAFLRLDLEDVPLPSFHRPDLVNFWYHRLVTVLVQAGLNQDDAVRAVIQPYTSTGIVRTDISSFTAEHARLIAEIKRRIMMRPIREDHPNFDGGNPQSIPPNLVGLNNLVKNNTNIAIPYWEAVGPWDVDNDNDGVADSVWIDLGDPVLEMEDGTRYKKLYAPLIIDLDSRLNVNANGLVDHIDRIPDDGISDPAALAAAFLTNGNFTIANLAGQLRPGVPMSSNYLPQGLGYGPPETSLRPVFAQPWRDASGTLDDHSNRSESVNLPIDDYAALLIGRQRQDGTGVSGRYGFGPATLQVTDAVTPGTNYRHLENAPSPRTGENAVPELAMQLKLFDYPWTIMERSAFGTPPDLMGRYALGLDFSGQPYYEALNDTNAWNNTLPRPLLTDTPYELNLSGKQRRQTSSAQFADQATAFNASLVPGQDDDAPYSLSDLERVLRAWDADSGTLPSRLWDVVNAFDPIKLMQYDPQRVTGMANQAFGSSNQPERLAAAQQLAGINRRLVTTDSFTPPVPSVNAPAYLLQAPEGITDPAQRMLYQQAINRHPPKSVAEMLELRIRREMGWPPTAFDDFDPNGDHNLDTIPNSTDPQYNQPNATAAQAARTARAAQISAITQQLLAPEVIAGKRMDLNRPFGDGQDNDGNGVVDDPMEAGDPFLDVNGNGKWDDDSIVSGGEPFINIDGSVDNSGRPTYTHPQDQLWAGLTAEAIAFDYTNGALFPIHKVVSDLLGIPANQAAYVSAKNLDSQGRQLYARHLYCLMLLLVDEGYIAPWDANDPQIREYLDTSIANSYAANLLAAVGNDAQEARRILLRKLTCQAIAQWAINAVDTRDADAIMTPFEYDENPWDGWGVYGRDGNFIPIDGDPATDENGIVNDPNPANNISHVIDWAAIHSDPQKRKAIGTVPAPANALGQTRGIVWGAERPELLITETLAVHDKRVEDLGPESLTTDPRDETLDQRLRPKGSLFVELYNPWSPTGQYPAEVYSLFDQNGALVDRNGSGGPADANDIMGVELGRLSTFGAKDLGAGNGSRLTMDMHASDSSVRRSPVWRLAIVEEHPTVRRLPDNHTEQPDPLGTNFHDGNPAPRYTAGNSFFEAADPDRAFSFFSQGWPTSAFPRNVPYVERSIYFTSDGATRFNINDERYLSTDPTSVNQRLRLPAEYQPGGNPGSANYFIAPDASHPDAMTGNVGDVAIAPIKPGRFAVVGTAGAQYEGKMTTSGMAPNGQPMTVPRYVTPLSRLYYGAADNEIHDDYHRDQIDKTPRIELFPSPNPEAQQILVASNGGTPLFPNTNVAKRDNEVVRLATGNVYHNIYDGDGNPTDANYVPTPDAHLIPPCVAIPVKDMSVSEPLDLYAKIRADLAGQPYPYGTGTQPTLTYDPRGAHGDGAFVDGPAVGGIPGKYDTPFDDVRPEFFGYGTQPNYRTIHLQRLANPMLPWNPQPKLPNGEDNPQHDARLPVNEYRTIDTSSVDLTVYNGVSRREMDTDNAEHNGRVLPVKVDSGSKMQAVRNRFGAIDTATGNVTQGTHRLHFRSLERGAHAKDRVANGVDLDVAARALWRQEPINLFADMQVWVDVPANDNVTRQAELDKRARDLRSRPQFILSEDIKAAQAAPMSKLQSIPDSLRVKEDPSGEPAACFDLVLDHSLGFANEAFGAMLSRTDLQPNNLPITADGTPAIDTPDFTRADPTPTTPIEATYPWLAWNNRPFVSAGELLNVPSQSSSQLLRKYSTLNNAVEVSKLKSPFNGAFLTNVDRFEAAISPFGHLFNFFQSNTTPAYTDKSNVDEWVFIGAPHYYRILDYVHVPSRFVGTDTMLTAEIFNSMPTNTAELVGTKITSPQDPRINFQPPFNKISKERDPGKINLNTVTGRRNAPPGAQPHIWSEVFDGLMHRVQDGNSSGQLAHGGPAWRDVVLSRRGYFDPNGHASPANSDRSGIYPDTIGSLLSPYSPTMFANPFRSPNAGDLVPLNAMVQHAGINATFQRAHHYAPADPASATINAGWGQDGVDDDGDGLIDDAREAGMGNDTPASTLPLSPAESRIPLFAENAINPSIDGNRNPAMMYQPMTRLENLVTNRSNVFAIWITVGYFEVEPAPNWETNEGGVRDRFNNDLNLYNRVYPDGYMLGKEVGSDTGNVQRPRGFYIVDRTEEVGFKPGEDLNVERAIKLRRRIE